MRPYPPGTLRSVWRINSAEDYGGDRVTVTSSNVDIAPAAAGAGLRRNYLSFFEVVAQSVGTIASSGTPGLVIAVLSPWQRSSRRDLPKATATAVASPLFAPLRPGEWHADTRKTYRRCENSALVRDDPRIIWFP